MQRHGTLDAILGAFFWNPILYFSYFVWTDLSCSKAPSGSEYLVCLVVWGGTGMLASPSRFSSHHLQENKGPEVGSSPT